MTDTFLQLPNNFITWISFIGLIILGMVAIYGQFFKAKDATSRQITSREASLIDVLQDQVAALESKVKQQESILLETNIKLDKLIAENETLRDILQGRDGATVEFRNGIKDAFGTVEKVLNVVQGLDSKLTSLLEQEVLETTTKKVRRI